MNIRDFMAIAACCMAVISLSFAIMSYGRYAETKRLLLGRNEKKKEAAISNEGNQNNFAGRLNPRRENIIVGFPAGSPTIGTNNIFIGVKPLQPPKNP